MRPEPMREAAEAGWPASARSLVRAARDAGWSARVTLVRGAPPDTDHYGPDGEWDRLAMVTVREPVYGEDGRPELTPTGKVRTRQVATDVPLVQTSVVVRLARGAQRAYGIWVDGAFHLGLVYPPGRILGRRDLQGWVER